MIPPSPRPMGGVHEGESTMKKIVTFAMAAGCALALTACGAKKEEAPAADTAADTEMMMPTPAPTDMPAAEETLDPTGNPIRPGASAAEDPMAAETAAAE